MSQEPVGSGDPGHSCTHRTRVPVDGFSPVGRVQAQISSPRSSRHLQMKEQLLFETHILCSALYANSFLILITNLRGRYCFLVRWEEPGAQTGKVTCSESITWSVVAPDGEPRQVAREPAWHTTACPRTPTAVQMKFKKRGS